jgi:NADH-quinone oxidoreductase subunit G
MIKIEVNGIEFLVKSTVSVLEACKYVGITIPRFCYHETLSIAGNCRMCLVEIANSPKPVAACALPVSNNIKIFTNTPLVKKARENIIETLLLNHPLDCPICDQGGECDLQDQTKNFGGDVTKFFVPKRTVEDKFCGPLIKTIMTRCIHCTRCVRFSSEIAGVDFFGTLNRGVHTEIGSYIKDSFSSEISGNVIDLCPVGALTSKVYAFKTRPWELRTVESIDLSDSTGSNTYINFKEVEILRVIPKINTEINNNLISDKGRFSYDSSKLQRITKVFTKVNHKFEQSNWLTFLKNYEVDLLTKKITFLVNDENDLESLLLLKQLSFKNPNIEIKSLSNSAFNHSNIFMNHINAKIADINKMSKVCILISTHLRIESAILNSKIRLKFINDDFKVYGLTKNYNSNFPVTFINLNINNFLHLLEGKHLLLSKILISFESPFIVLGESFFKFGLNYHVVVKFIKKIIPSALIFNIGGYSNSESKNLLNIKSLANSNYKKSDILICLNLADNIYLAKMLQDFNNKIFWFNTHGSSLALKANTILPILSDFEEENIFINLEQRPQKTGKVFCGTHDTKSLKSLLKYLINLSKNIIPSFILEILNIPNLFNKLSVIFSLQLIKKNQLFSLVRYYPIKGYLEDFYLSNKNTKNSLIMLETSRSMRKKFTNFN